MCIIISNVCWNSSCHGQKTYLMALTQQHMQVLIILLLRHRPTMIRKETLLIVLRWGLFIEAILSASRGCFNKPVLVIKSTAPVGVYRVCSEKVWNRQYYFSVELLREFKSLYDNLCLSRIIVGCDNKNC